MEKSQILHKTLIEKSVSAMWQHFELSHDELLADVINQVKGSIFLSAEDVMIIKDIVRTKLVPLVEDMSQRFSDYRLSMQTHLAAMLKRQLKIMIDFKMGQIGLDADDQN